VPLGNMQRWIASLWLGLVVATAGAAIVCPAPAMAQQDSKTEELTRRPKTRVSPVYPELARRMSITGTVRLAVVVAPNGQVKTTKAIGGHPILVNAAMDAMKQWKFEPAQAESTGVVEFKFQPHE
jgi:TonB family protein